MSRRVAHHAVVLAVVLLVAGGAVGVAARSAVGALPDEYRVKAAILYHLAKFVEWPADAFPAPDAPFAVCVLGVDPFGELLDESLKGRQVAGRAFAVRRLAEPQGGCHVLFIATSERRRLGLITEQLGKTGVLTVSEEDGFTALGGIVELINEAGKVHFHINAAAAERARLRVSARLLALAANPRHAEDAK